MSEAKVTSSVHWVLTDYSPESATDLLCTSSSAFRALKRCSQCIWSIFRRALLFLFFLHLFLNYVLSSSPLTSPPVIHKKKTHTDRRLIGLCQRHNKASFSPDTDHERKEQTDTNQTNKQTKIYRKTPHICFVSAMVLDSAACNSR